MFTCDIINDCTCLIECAAGCASCSAGTPYTCGTCADGFATDGAGGCTGIVESIQLG